MKLTTRLRILDYLRKHQTASTRELGQSLGMTGANIRHHLAVLEANDLIEMIAQRREGRGRPVMVYGLSRHVLGDSLDELSAALLEEWLGGLTDDERDAGIRSLAERMVGGMDISSAAPMAKRLNSTVDHLNQLHYQARWEAGAAGPRMVLGHCPFVAIIERCPELCKMDLHLLALLVGANSRQVAKLEKGTRGEKYCAFQIL